jgi:hypothetical protein
MAAKTLKPGDKISTPGIYLVFHDKLHCFPERQLFVTGNRLPECEICGSAVRYELEAPCVPQLDAMCSFATA